MNAFGLSLSRCLAIISISAIPFIPRATAAEFRGASWTPQKDRAALVHVPEGARRLRLQTRASADAPWTVVGVVHLEGRAGTLKMRLPDGIALEDVLLETSTADPFPYAFYQGQTSFRGNASPSPGGFRGGPEMLVPGVAIDNDATVGGTTTAVEESDIWKWRGRTLYYFNSLRGLQVFDLSDFANPRRVAGLRMPAVGEDMYLIGADHVALLANRYDSGWYGSSTPTRSEVVMIHHAGEALTEASRVPIEGTFIDSRLIGSTLCVVTRKTEMISLANGGVTYVPKTNVYALDLADPTRPQVRGPLELTDDDTSWSWNTEVHATAEFLFVGTDYWRAGENTRTRVHVIDLRTPGQPLSVGARFELRGQLLNKFQLTYAGGILTTVSQAAGAVVETWDVATALDQGTSIPKPLDSLLVGANEGLFGTRFDGDRVYVVTFRRIDPLFCVDLANPRDLRLLGELEVPGFSTYLEAFADGSRLMSVGVEAGRVAVSLFDVADPGHPSLKGRVHFGDDGHGSWSEANYDDKAIGFFQSEGLLVIPLSQWTTDHGYRNGMQVVDVTSDSVRGRGFIDHRFSARRGRLFDQTLVSISGTELVIVDLADRDRPAQVASLTIAWPVQEALPYGNSLVQLESGDSYVYDPDQSPRTARLRIAPKSNRDVLDADVDLGVAGEIAGATILGDTLYVILRSTEQRMVQGAEGQLWEWSSLLTTLVVDLAHAGGPHVQGAAPSPSASNHWASGHLDAHWLSGGRLLWVPSRAGNSWFGCMRCPVAFDGVGMGVGAAIDIAGPFWWWGGGSEDFLVVDVVDHTKPRVIAREALVLDSETAYWNSSRAFVTANNRLLAAWTAWRQEGTIWFEESIVQEIDLSDSAAPRRGPKATVPGRLEGIHRTDAGGSVLFTSRTEVTPGPDDSTTWTSNALIDVLAYDGTQAFLLDTARAEGSANMSAATVGTHLLIATQPSSPTDQPKGALRVLGWDDATGKLKALPDVPVSAGWPSLSEHGGFVFAVNSGQLDVIAAHQLPAPPATASLHLDVPVWDQSNLQLDPDLPVAWQPVDSFGVERLDLGALPPSPQQRAARDRRVAEWHSLALLPVDVVPAGSLDGPGSLGAADDFRFTADDAAETFAQWQNRYFTEPFGQSASVLGDPDGDGFGNYAEWAFDSSPIDPLSQPSVTAALVRLNPGDPERLVLVARLNPLAEVDELPIGSYLSLTPQISTDAASWQNVPRDEVELIVTPVRRMFVLPARRDASTVFGRLQVFFVIEG